MGNLNFRSNPQINSDHVYFPNSLFPYEEFSKNINNGNILHIGKGTFSNIYKIMGKYAVKMINSTLLNNLDNITELSILNGLNCDHIIKSHGYFIINNKLSIVMDYYEFTLFDCMNISIHNKKIIIKQLYEAIKHLHERNILHLDIKPENILLNDKMKPTIVLTDFSLSCKINEDIIIFKEHRITTYYRPYENLKGSLEYSKKSDLWSFGILINELLIGTKIENRLMNIHMIDNDTFSLQIYIEKMFAWGIWPPKYSDEFEYIQSFLNIDKNKRILNHDIINNESLYETLNKIHNRIIINHGNTNEIYNICNIIVNFLYANEDNILHLIDIKNIDSIIKVLSSINFNVFN